MSNNRTKRRPAAISSGGDGGRPHQRPRYLPPTNNIGATGVLVAQTVDLPEIPGVPIHVTPQLVEALRSATKWFSHATMPSRNPIFHREEQEQQLRQQQEQDVSNSRQHGPTSSVVDSILNRMTAVSDEEKVQSKRLERMNQAAKAFLDALVVQRRQRAKSNNGVRHGDVGSVPLSCFRYLWDLTQHHGRVAVRRASLNLCGQLLLTDDGDCRMHLNDSDDVLFQWVTCVVQAKGLQSSTNNGNYVPCWQTEALEWMTHLSKEYGGGRQNNKFRVARQFLEQRCSSAVASSSSSSSITNPVAVLTMDHQQQHGGAWTTEGNDAFANNIMPDLRRIRDIAIKYGDREIIKVDKLIQRAHKNLDVLVPRMGGDVPNDTIESADDADGEVVLASAARAPSSSVNEDDSDDDIDWEDGDEAFFQGGAPEDHAEAVERTLAAMASAGGLRGGAMEINLESNEGGDEQDDLSKNDGNEKARQVLHRAVQSIQARHMKRLSIWVDALIKADGLVRNENNSLVIMSANVARMRNDTLHKLLERKQALANILASATKLGLSVESSSSSDRRDAPLDETMHQRRRGTRTMTNIPPQRQAAVLATAARRPFDSKVARRPRSTKVQIKFRTS